MLGLARGDHSKYVISSVLNARHLHRYYARTCRSTLRLAPNDIRISNFHGNRLASSNASTPQTDNNLEVGHSRFIAEASKEDKWKEGVGNARKGGSEGTSAELGGVSEGKGKIVPTSSHLFKLILPLPRTRKEEQKENLTRRPMVFLLHPSQPLSHVSRLIISAISPKSTPDISFHSISKKSGKGRVAEWSDSTDIGDFIKDASRAGQFNLTIAYPHKADKSTEPESITVSVPTFEQRTLYLRRKLTSLKAELEKMESIKSHCDRVAHRGARRGAIGGFVILLTYWGIVARLTFWDYGWEIMEPITYLSGLTTVITGYLWFLWHNREVSYTSVLSQSVATRRTALYEKHGLVLDDWAEKRALMKAIRREILGIAEEYGVDWDEKLPNDEDEDDEDADGGQGDNARKDVEEQERRQ